MRKALSEQTRRLLLVDGLRLFQERAFFDAHELLEERLWREETHPVGAQVLQAMIQWAVSMVHVERRNVHGAKTMIRKALERIKAVDPQLQGRDCPAYLLDQIRVTELATAMAATRQRLFQWEGSDMSDGRLFDLVVDTDLASVLLPFPDRKTGKSSAPQGDGAHTLATLKIERLVTGGDGLARWTGPSADDPRQGQVTFVRGVVPGERVRVSLPNEPAPKKQSFLRAQLLDVVEPSLNRVPSDCPVFPVCGGCDWRHLVDEAQKQAKVDILRDTLARLGGLQELPDIGWIGWQDDHQRAPYRNHVTWQVDPTTGRLGFYEPESHHVVPFNRCRLVDDMAHVLIDLIAPWVKASQQALGLTSVDARWCPETGEMLLMFTGQAARCPNEAALRTEAQRWEDACQALLGRTLRGVVWRGSRGDAPQVVWGRGWLTMAVPTEVGRLDYRVSAGGFFQSNAPVLGALLDTLPTLLGDVHPKRVLDLYAGVGTFGLWWLTAYPEAHVQGVESAPTAAADAAENLKGIAATRWRWDTARVDDAVSRLKLANWDVVLVDPPRNGCAKPVLQWLCGGDTADKPARLIYLSCDPATLARDLKMLTQEGGWALDSVQLVNMFPQTHHLETLVVLKPVDRV